MADVSSIWDFLVGGGGLLAGGGGSFAGMRLYLRSLTTKAQGAADKADRANKKAEKALTHIEVINSRCADHQAHQSEAAGRLEGVMTEGFKRLEMVINAQREEFQKGLTRAHERIDRLRDGTGS